MKRKLFRGLALLVACAAYAFFVGCPLYRLTNIPCPFCGMTRAHIALVTDGFSAALAYHSLFFLGLPTLACIFALDLTRKRSKRLHVANVLVLVVLFGAIWIRYLFF